MSHFKKRLRKLTEEHEALFSSKNEPLAASNGIFQRWIYPVLTGEHAPLFWRYDLDKATNPLLQERLAVHGTSTPGAVYCSGKYLLVTRVEGYDGSFFFAVAESDNGVEGFRFWDYPLALPEIEGVDLCRAELRLTAHEDGFIYATVSAEQGEANGDGGAAPDQHSLFRTQDLNSWERLGNVVSEKPLQGALVLHSHRIGDAYAFSLQSPAPPAARSSSTYVGIGLTPQLSQAEITLDLKLYDPPARASDDTTGRPGPAPIKTREGWLHLVHDVRKTSAGQQAVVRVYMTDLQEPWLVRHRPEGYLLAAQSRERAGDVSAGVRCHGWIVNDDDEVFIYYAASDARVHVATSSIEQLLDYVKNTPQAQGAQTAPVAVRCELIRRNLARKDQWK